MSILQRPWIGVNFSVVLMNTLKSKASLIYVLWKLVQTEWVNFDRIIIPRSTALRVNIGPGQMMGSEWAKPVATELLII